MIKFWQDTVKVWGAETERLTSYKSWNSWFWNHFRVADEASSEKTESQVVQLIDSTLLYGIFNTICILFF